MALTALAKKAEPARTTTTRRTRADRVTAREVPKARRANAARDRSKASICPIPLARPARQDRATKARLLRHPQSQVTHPHPAMRNTRYGHRDRAALRARGV